MPTAEVLRRLKQEGVYDFVNALPVSNAVKFGLLASIAHLMGYWGSNLLLYITWRNRWFQKSKIQGLLMPSQQHIISELKDSAGDTLAIPLLAYVFYKLLTLGGRRSGAFKEAKEGKASAKESKQCKQEENEAGGYSNIRWHGKRPGFWRVVGQVGTMYLIYDFLFYWSHRWLHWPQNYKKYHFRHHLFKTPVGISASYAHPVENIIQTIAWWVPVGLTGWLYGDLHASTIWYYNLFRWLETVDAHCGYAFWWSPFTWFPLFSGARGHDFHHSHYLGNYGATIIWDTLLGTNQHYGKHLRRLREQ